MSDVYLPNAYTEQFSDLYKQFYIHTGKASTCKNVTFVVTEDCTLRCTYCYECHKNKDNRMTFETAKKCVDMMFEEDMHEGVIFGKNADAVILEFIGGEPLLEIKLIDQIMDYFLEKAVELDHRWKTEYMISMISNGTLYNTKSVQEFIKKFDGRLCLGVSIDGNKQLHDSCRIFPDGSPSFDIAQKAYIDLLNKGICNGTKMTIAPENLPYLADALKELIMYDHTTSLPANPIYEAEWTFEQAKLFYDQLKDYGQWDIDNEIFLTRTITLFQKDNLGCKYSKEDDKNYCGGTCLMLAFAPTGEIYPCTRYLPFSLQNKDKREKMLIGDCDNGFLKRKSEQERYKFLESVTMSSQSTDKCINCPIAMGCGWCSAWNYDLYGTVNKRFTGICNMHKARVMANVWYWNTLYRKYDIHERFPLNIPKDWALEIISEDEWNTLVELSKVDY